MADGIEIVDNPAESRFELRVDGAQAGFAAYRLQGDRITLTHTEIGSEWEGKGLAGKLVGQVLDASRDRGLKVVPLCPYVAKYIDRHPQYADLVTT